MTIQAFVILAVLIEAFTGLIKTLLQNFGVVLKDWMDQLISLVLAVAVAAGGKVDFFVVLSQVLPINFGLPPVVGIVLSAVVLARGSNAVHDLLKKLNPSKEGSLRIW
ncbi:MAG TPA: hypothetical protein GX510_04245 [Firmicutes bacterium]|nr:hypothetical protein [Candidatus Fermentithermobacillaceae bacterium]